MIKTKKSFFNFTFIVSAFLIIALLTLPTIKAKPVVNAEDEFTVSWDSTTKGYTSGSTVVTDITFGDGMIVAGKFDKAGASVDPVYYEVAGGDSSTGAIRLYAKGTFTVNVLNDSYKITQVVFTFGDGDNTNAILASNGVYDSGIWTGKTDEVVFTIDGTNKHRRIQTVTVTYAGHSHAVKETHDRVEPTCIRDGHETYYECDCGMYFEDEDCLVVIGDETALSAWLLDEEEGGLLPAVGHTYTGEITYVWDDVTHQCTATRYCDFDCGEFLTETVQGEYVKDTYATCETNEKGHYKATFMTSGFGVKETQANSFEVENTMLNHQNRRIEYSWNDETHECTASLYCNICLKKLDSETVQGEYVKDINATCETSEMGHFKATFERLSQETKQTERNSYEVPSSKLGHTDGEVVYEWNGNKCVAYKYCERCHQVIETKIEIGEYVKDYSATCSANEKGHYVAFDGVQGYEKQTTLMFDLEGTKLGHDYTITYQWNEDKTKCVASAHCKGNDSDIEESATVEDGTVTKENGYYVATFENEYFRTQKVAIADGEEDANGSSKIMLYALMGLGGLTVVLTILVICLMCSVAGLKKKGIKAPVETEKPAKEEKPAKAKKEKEVASPKEEKETKQPQTASNNAVNPESKKAKLDKIQQVLDSLEHISKGTNSSDSTDSPENK